MIRVERKIQCARLGNETKFDPDQQFIEEASRGRAARSIRASVRKMEPVVVRTPRWGRPAQFLEELALDLAVGQPGIGCRTVDLHPLKGRKANESWQFTLQLFSQMGRRDWQNKPPGMVADRGGFRFALAALIEEAQRTVSHPVALLAHGAENLPVEILEDLAFVWDEYCDWIPDGRRCTFLLAGVAGGGWIPMSHAPQVDLVDFGEAEAAAAILGAGTRLPFEQLRKAAHFTGGVPGLVDAIAERARKNPLLPEENDELLHSMGPLVDEIRGAVDIVNMDSALADRLYDLLDGGPDVRAPEVDDGLQLAGLIRTVRSHGEEQVEVRAPAIGTLLK